MGKRLLVVVALGLMALSVGVTGCKDKSDLTFSHISDYGSGPTPSNRITAVAGTWVGNIIFSFTDGSTKSGRWELVLQQSENNITGTLNGSTPVTGGISDYSDVLHVRVEGIAIDFIVAGNSMRADSASGNASTGAGTSSEISGASGALNKQ